MLFGANADERAGDRVLISKAFVIDGRVQGVGFRYFVVREAQAMGLAGWVRNLPDGRVEVLACGETDVVNAFEGRLWQGPPHARVSTVEAREAEVPAHAEFRVLPTPW
jgi:acylphosphatase